MKIIRFLLFCGLGLALVFANVYTVLAKAPTTARIVFFSLRDGKSEYLYNGLRWEPTSELDQASFYG
jgi:hypothetical protein